MHKVLVIGAGKIGSLITFLLAIPIYYFVYLADIHEKNPYERRLSTLKNVKYLELDANDANGFADLVANIRWKPSFHPYLIIATSLLPKRQPSMNYIILI